MSIRSACLGFFSYGSFSIFSNFLSFGFIEPDIGGSERHDQILESEHGAVLIGDHLVSCPARSSARWSSSHLVTSHLVT